MSLNVSSMESLNLNDICVIKIPGLEESAFLLSSFYENIGRKCSIRSFQGDDEDSSTVVVPAFGLLGTVNMASLFLHLSRMLTVLSRGNKETPIVIVLTCLNEGPLVDDIGTGKECGGAAIWGMMRTARLELQNRIDIVCMDTDAISISGGIDGDSTIRQLDNEIEFHGDEVDIAYRSGVRYCRRLQKSLVQTSTSQGGIEKTRNTKLSNEQFLDMIKVGTALITGGLGGLGVLTAEVLCTLGIQCLVLVSRSGKIKYDEQGLQERLDDVAKTGTEVIYYKCDVGEENEVVTMLNQIRSTHGPLRAVFHAAGSLSDGTIQNQTEESFSKVFRAKSDGAWYLHKHTSHDDLGAFVVYSSIAALFGNFGQANYSFSNANIDELIGLRVSKGLCGLSIQWPAILGVGMAAAMDKSIATSKSFSIDSETMKAVLKQILCNLNSCSTVEAVIPHNLIKDMTANAGQMKHFISQVSLSDRNTQMAIAHFTSRSSARANNVSREDIVKSITDATMELLDGDASFLDVEKPLIDMGLDSLASMQLVRSVNNLFEISLSPTALFDFPTVDILADHVFETLNDVTKKDLLHLKIEPGNHEHNLAVIGMSGRFPGGVEGPGMLWKAIEAGNCMIESVPFDRWDNDAVGASQFLSDDVKQRMRHGGFLKNADMFDASSFKISPAEAIEMDPQQRLLLEYAYLAFDDAGLTAKELEGRNIGVFVGINSNDALLLSGDKAMNVYSVNGTSHATAAGRISFTFGLRGPCVAYDTACSSSLVALHHASRALQYNDCDIAIVMGVFMTLTHEGNQSIAISKMASPTGRCHTFDQRANGYVRGEGCCAVVLKRSNDVVNARDRVHSLIHSVTVAQDGTSASLTSPNGRAQEQLIERALHQAGISGNEIDYLEAHGTGTALGDPIEIGALANVLGKGRAPSCPLVMGGVKANIGHLEPAAGVAGLIKAILVLQNEIAPPNSELRVLNPAIQKISEVFPVHFPTTAEILRKYSSKDASKPLMAGVSSFGYAGTIAHAIIGQPPISMARKRSEVNSSPHGIENNSIVFLCTGQGSQYFRMGKQLYDEDLVFRTAMDECAQVFMEYTGESLLDILFVTKENSNIIHEQQPHYILNETKYSQPALFAIEWSLSESWRSRGVTPSLVLGHSVGEIVAACIAGVISMKTGMELSAKRGALMQSIPPQQGVMYAIRCSHDHVEKAILKLSELEANFSKKVSVACVNGPNSVVVSGVESAVMSILDHLGYGSKNRHRLSVSHAFHSPLMIPMLEDFRSVLETMEFGPCKIPLVSTVNGRVMDVGEVLDLNHWLKQVTSPVLFSTAIEACMERTRGENLPDSVGVAMLEIGPSPVLTGMCRAWTQKKYSGKISWHASINPKSSLNDTEVLEESFAAIKSNFTIFQQRDSKIRSYRWIPLPHPFLQIKAQDRRNSIFKAVFYETLVDEFSDHKIKDKVLFPGTGYLEFALAAVSATNAKGFVNLLDVNFLKPFDVELGRCLRCEISDDNKSAVFLGEDDDVPFCTIGETLVSSDGAIATQTLSQLRSHCGVEIPGISERYEKMDKEGFHGRQFQTISQIWQSQDKQEFLAKLDLPINHNRYHIHPALLDGAAQIVGFLDNPTGEAIVPASIERVTLNDSIGRSSTFVEINMSTWVHACVVKEDDSSRLYTMDFSLFGESDEGEVLLLTMKKFRFSKFNPHISQVSRSVKNTQMTIPHFTSKSSSRINKISRDNIATLIVDVAKELLDEDVGSLDFEKPLIDMGLDSLASMQLVRSVNSSFDIRLSPTALFDFCSINALADHLFDTLNGPETKDFIHKKNISDVHGQGRVLSSAMTNNCSNDGSININKRLMEAAKKFHPRSWDNFALGTDQLEFLDLLYDSFKIIRAQKFLLRISEDSSLLCRRDPTKLCDEDVLVFLFAGAGCIPYFSYPGFENLLPPWIVPVFSSIELPSHQYDGSPRDKVCMEEAIAKCANSILIAASDCTFVFMGHSAGGLDAYLVTRYLQMNGKPAPKGLFMAGSPSCYDLPQEMLDAYFEAEYSPFKLFSAVDPDYAERMEIERTWQLGSWQIADSYKNSLESMSVPFRGIWGDKDEIIPWENFLGWKERVLTTNERDGVIDASKYSLRIIKGGLHMLPDPRVNGSIECWGYLVSELEQILGKKLKSV